MHLERLPVPAAVKPAPPQRITRDQCRTNTSPLRTPTRKKQKDTLSHRNAMIVAWLTRQLTTPARGMEP